ncbi:hypothetical protein B0H13DRAFT_2300461 [Mycena leptocephala]|nr:hypothetical protein B0H13DRAFT_2300461 [Mycena leptocephala]
MPANSVNVRYPLPSKLSPSPLLSKLSPSPLPRDNTQIYYPANLILILSVPEEAKGQVHKKLKTQRKTRQARQDRQYDLRSAARHVHTSAFLACEELVLYHLLEACTLASLIALSHTSVFFRMLVKTLFRIRLIAAVDPFVGHDNTAKFFEVLQSTGSAIAGSTIARILAPPIDDIDDWMPNNLNIYPPLGCTIATDFAATRDMTLNGGSYYSYKSRHSVLPPEIPGKRYSPRFRGVVIGTVIGQELTAGGQGVNVRLSLPVGCTEEVKVLFKKQTTLLREVETVDSGDRPSAKTEGVIITGAAEIEDLIISVKAKILRWTETGFFPNGSNLAMRVSLTRLDSVEGGLSNSRKKHVDHRVYLLIAESYRILEGNAFGTQEVEMDCLDVDDLSDLA